MKTFSEVKAMKLQAEASLSETRSEFYKTCKSCEYRESNHAPDAKCYSYELPATDWARALCRLEICPKVAGES